MHTLTSKSCMLLACDEKGWRSHVSWLRCTCGTSHRRGLDECLAQRYNGPDFLCHTRLTIFVLVSHLFVFEILHRHTMTHPNYISCLRAAFSKCHVDEQFPDPHMSRAFCRFASLRHVSSQQQNQQISMLHKAAPVVDKCRRLVFWAALCTVPSRVWSRNKSACGSWHPEIMRKRRLKGTSEISSFNFAIAGNSQKVLSHVDQSKSCVCQLVIDSINEPMA